MMQSLQSKLSLGLLFSQIITFSLLWFLVSFNAQFIAQEYIASRLQHDTESLLSGIHFDAQNNIHLDKTRLGAIYNQPFSGHYYVVTQNHLDKSTQVYSRSLWDQTLKVNSVETGQHQQQIQQGPEQQKLLVLSSGYSKKGIKFTISSAEDLNPITENINQFLVWFAGLSISLLLLQVLLQVFILRYILKPLTAIKSELKSLEQGQLDRLSNHVPSELKPLIYEINHLLKMLEQRLKRSRDALSDLAHAIKKPLTVIQQITHKSELDKESRAILIGQTDDIHQLSDHILKRARLAGRSHGGTLFSFNEDVPALLKTLHMMHNNQAITIEQQIDSDLSYPFDREDMLELLGNLLDNAFKWAKQTIQLSIFVDEQLHIRIQDDGKGIDPDKIKGLSNRGVRLDENVKGHGFGLAISADIVSDYGGHISFKQSSELGGFQVDITLP